MSFWTNKKVVLLGGASLIGSHLAKSLLDKGAMVKVVDDLSSGKTSNFAYLKALPVKFFQADLREIYAAGFAVNGQEIVFHLASQHGGRGYVSGHKVELYDNLSLDATIFRACAEARVEKVIFSSSACAYPIHLQNDINKLVYLREDMIDYNNLQQADGAYGTEKLVGEAMLNAYIERGDFKGCSTRSFTVYGPLMKENHAIAALIAKTVIRQDPFEIWGDGKQIRNWTYVEDNVAGAMLAAEYLDSGAINIGVEDRLTPLGAACEVWAYMGWQPDTIFFMKDKPVGPINRVADATKIMSIGWRPSVTFKEGIRKTIDWYASTHDIDELKKDFEKKLTER